MARPRRTRTVPVAHATPTVRWRLALILLAGALVYANSLSGPFIFDDTLAIVGNTQIRDWRTVSVLTPERESPLAGRPLVNVSFAINYAMNGLDVRGYHAVNIAVHLLCALLVFGTIRRTLELPRVRERLDTSVNIAFAAALVWLVHPLNSEPVDYLTQRTESMMALFYLRAALVWTGPRLHSAGFSSGVPAWTYFLNQTVMITRYLRLTIWPRSLVVHWTRPSSTSRASSVPSRCWRKP